MGRPGLEPSRRLGPQGSREEADWGFNLSGRGGPVEQVHLCRLWVTAAKEEAGRRELVWGGSSRKRTAGRKLADSPGTGAAWLEGRRLKLVVEKFDSPGRTTTEAHLQRGLVQRGAETRLAGELIWLPPVRFTGAGEPLEDVWMRGALFCCE